MNRFTWIAAYSLLGCLSNYPVFADSLVEPIVPAAPIAPQTAAVTQTKVEDSLKNLNESRAILSSLEKRFFEHSYGADSIEQRTVRLEEFVFLKPFTGNLSSRLKRLSNALAPVNVSTKNESTTGDSALGKSATDSASDLATATIAHTSGALDTNKAGVASEISAASVPAVAVKTIPLIRESSTKICPNANNPKPISLIDAINRGIDNYNLHRYHNAEDDFEMTCAMAPGMSRVFAYLAITKLQLNEYQAAIDSFRTSYSLDPFGTYGRYAKHCLLTLAGDQAIRSHSPVDSSKVLDDSINKINQQSSSEIARHNSEGNNFARTHSSNAGFGADAYVQAARARTESALRGAYAQESANNLKHLMGVKRVAGDANLRAWGTNLTTRYYGDDTYLYPPYYIPRERPLELKAIAVSLAQSKLIANRKTSQHHKAGNQNSTKNKKRKR